MTTKEGLELKVEGTPEPTPPAAKATVEEVYKTEAEFQTAVSKGLRSMTEQLSTKENEVSRSKAEAEAAKGVVKALEESITDLEKRLEEHYDPDELKAYRLEIREKKVTLKEASMAEAEARHKAEVAKWTFATEMDSYRRELQKEYQVPAELLEISVSKEQMEKIAKAFPKVGETKEPKFDNLISSGGQDWHTLSPDEKIQRGLSQKKK